MANKKRMAAKMKPQAKMAVLGPVELVIPPRLAMLARPMTQEMVHEPKFEN